MGRVILVRHGQCQANVAGVSLGRRDSPLTDLGRRQAAAVARALAAEPVVQVIASPLSRAADTAATIAAEHGHHVQTEEALVEMDIGEMEGLTWAAARERYAAFIERWIGDETAALTMPQGESLRQVQERAWPILAPYLETNADDTNSDHPTTILVSHNFVIRTLVCAALDLDLNRWRQFELDLTGRTVFERRRGGTVLRTLNDASHLGADLQA